MAEISKSLVAVAEVKEASAPKGNSPTKKAKKVRKPKKK